MGYGGETDAATWSQLDQHVTHATSVSPELTPPRAGIRPPWPRRIDPPVAALTGLATAVAYDLEYIAAAAVALLFWEGGVAAQRAAGRSAVQLRHGRPAQIAVAVFAAMAIATTLNIVHPSALGPTLLGLAVATLMTALWEVAQRARRPATRILLVGDPTAVAAQALDWAGQPGVEVIGSFTQSRGGTTRDKVADAVSNLGADVVICVPGPEFASAELQRLAWELESTPATILVSGVVDRVAAHRLASGTFAGRSVVAVSPSRRGWLEETAKSAFDRVTAAVLIVLLAPLFLLIAVIVRLDSEGPVIFRQRRVGMGGRPFRIYKFRTMHLPGSVAVPLQRTAGNEVLFKMRDDPRVTRAGRVLRRLSLDELPQLVNVLRGEMSMIGPRPALFEETSKYDDHAWRRTAIKPGITGLWQVSGRSDLSWEKSIMLDVQYVDNWRLGHDVRILARTLSAVVRGKGAY